MGIPILWVLRHQPEEAAPLPLGYQQKQLFLALEPACKFAIIELVNGTYIEGGTNVFSLQLA